MRKSFRACLGATGLLLACNLVGADDEDNTTNPSDTGNGDSSSATAMTDATSSSSSGNDEADGSSTAADESSTGPAPSCEAGCADDELCYAGQCYPIGFSTSFSGGMSRQGVWDLALDPDGNIVIVGSFDEVMELGDIVLEGAGAGLEVFVAKLDPSGVPVWGRVFTSEGFAHQYGIAIDVGDDGTIAVLGELQESIDFGEGPVQSAGESDVFVAALDPSGTTLWARTFGDDANQLAADLAVLPDGGVAVTGSFFGNIDFGGGALVSDGDATDVFIAVLDSDGAHRWSVDAGDDAYQYARSITTGSDGTVATCGEFEGTIDLGSGSYDAQVGDLYVATFAADGTPAWSLASADAGADTCTSIAIDGGGNLGITGRYANGLDFGGGAGLPDDDYRSFKFASTFDGSGAHAWSRGFGSGTQAEMGMDTDEIVFDNAGNVIIAGVMTAAADFGGGPLPSEDAPSMFVAKLDASGTQVWAQTWVSPDLRQAINGIAIDERDAIVVGGEFQGELDVGFGPLVTNASADAMVARFLP